MKISKLQKKIGQFTLQIEELYLESGKVHGLIGTNGCGKTTLSKLIQGILVPDGGRIDYEGLTGFVMYGCMVCLWNRFKGKRDKEAFPVGPFLAGGAAAVYCMRLGGWMI